MSGHYRGSSLPMEVTDDLYPPPLPSSSSCCSRQSRAPIGVRREDIRAVTGWVVGSPCQRKGEWMLLQNPDLVCHADFNFFCNVGKLHTHDIFSLSQLACKFNYDDCTECVVSLSDTGSFRWRNVMLPSFRRNVLPPYSGSKWLSHVLWDENVSILCELINQCSESFTCNFTKYVRAEIDFSHKMPLCNYGLCTSTITVVMKRRLRDTLLITKATKTRDIILQNLLHVIFKKI